MSWATDTGLYIIGGWNGGEKTSEKILPDGSVEEGFALRYSTSFSCAIPDPDNDEVIITGGVDDNLTTGTLYTRVSVYNEQGWSRDLAPLATGRRFHACTSYTLGGKKVNLLHRHQVIDDGKNDEQAFSLPVLNTVN